MRVLITGGTGSLGRALCRYLLTDAMFCPERLVSFARSEYRQHLLNEKLKHHRSFKTFLGDVREKGRLLFALEGIDLVIHAAALKRVDSAQYNPPETIKTNVLGTMNVIEAAIERGVKKVLVISSDKAVEAANIYGATKACAEHYGTSSNNFSPRGRTAVSVVRYGNVLTSTGSVYWIFKKQMEDDVPFTITDVNMTRFALMMPDAVRFVRRCADMMRGGEIFVPRLPSLYVKDMASAMDAGRPIEEIGLRPGGEKLGEVLISEQEACRTVYSKHDRCFIINPSHAEWGYHPWRASESGDLFTARDPYQEYASWNNTEWLDQAAIREKLEGYQDDRLRD